MNTNIKGDFQICISVTLSFVKKQSLLLDDLPFFLHILNGNTYGKMVMSFNKMKLVNGYLLVVSKLLLERFSFFNHNSKIFQHYTNVNYGNEELAKLSRNL